MGHGPFKLAIYAVLSLALCACGVETGGSAEGDFGALQIYEGIFLNRDGTPSSGVSAVVLESGDSCVSDSSGSCQIESRALSGEISIEVRFPGAPIATLSIAEIPADATTIHFTARQSDTALSLVELSFNSPSAEPTPSATLAPGQPTPKATATPIAGPTKTPDPKAEAIARGKRVYQNICGQCHGPGKAAGYSASQVTAAMALSQHARVRLGSQLSDLVAFLNR